MTKKLLVVSFSLCVGFCIFSKIDLPHRRITHFFVWCFLFSAYCFFFFLFTYPYCAHFQWTFVLLATKIEMKREQQQQQQKRAFKIQCDNGNPLSVALNCIAFEYKGFTQSGYKNWTKRKKISFSLLFLIYIWTSWNVLLLLLFSRFFIFRPIWIVLFSIPLFIMAQVFWKRCVILETCTYVCVCVCMLRNETAQAHDERVSLTNK